MKWPAQQHNPPPEKTEGDHWRGWYRIISWVQKNNFTTSNTVKKHRGFATKCKPLVTLKKSKARLDFNRKHLNAAAQFWKNSSIRLMWGEKHGAHDHHTLQYHLSNMVDTVLWHGYVWLPVTSVYWRCDCWQRPYCPLRFSQMLENWSEFHITNLRVQYILQWRSQSPDLNTWNSDGEFNRLTVAEWPHCRLYI